MKAVEFTKKLDGVNGWVGRVFMWTLVPLMLLMVYEVVTRRILTSPPIWTFDICRHLFAIHFLMALGFALLRDVHVRVDFIYRLLSTRGKAVIDVATYVLFLFPLLGILIWQTSLYAKASIEVWERTYDIVSLPIWHVKSVIPIAFFLLMLQAVSEFIKRVLVLKGKTGS